MAGRSVERNGSGGMAGDGRVPGMDEAGMSTLYKENSWVNGTIYRRVGEYHTAEDLTQDTFERAWKARGTIRDPNAATGFVGRIASNVTSTYLRRTHGEGRDVDPAGLGNEEGQFNSVFDSQGSVGGSATAQSAEDVVISDIGFSSMLDGLRPRQRQALELRFLNDLTDVEVAKAMGVSVGTAKSTIARALAILRDKYDGGLEEVK